jgi:hypothetical protein
MTKKYSIYQSRPMRFRQNPACTTQDYPLKMYMDESGNGNKDLPLIVGAIATDVDADNLEFEIKRLYEELSARRAYRGWPSFEDFRKNGFHAKNDPVEISAPFMELIQRNIGFKAYLYITDRSTPPELTESAQIELLYSTLLADNLIRHQSRAEILCFIEENNSIGNLPKILPNLATRRAEERLEGATRLPILRVSMIKKQEAMSMALIDYIMSAVSRWVRSGYTTEISEYGYRSFRAVESAISVLYSLERGLFFNRKMDVSELRGIIPLAEP